MMFLFESSKTSSKPIRAKLHLRTVLEHPLVRYGIAVLAVGIGLLVESSFPKFIEPVIFTLFIHVVFLTAWFAGFGPAIFSTLLILVGVQALFSSSFLTPPEDQFALRMFSFGCTAVLISWFISRWRRATGELQESEERLSLAQAASRAGAWEWNPKTQEVNSSTSLERLYGYPPGTLKDFQDLKAAIHPKDVLRFETELATAIKEHKQIDLEFRVIHSSGEVLWISSRGRAHTNRLGEVIRVYGFNLDITERKKFEKELADLADRERTARKAAEDANNAKSTFLANMSHEIRTPIGAILGFTELLKNPDTTPQDQTSFLETISRNGIALNHLINDILDLSKVEAGRMEIEWVHFSLIEAVSEVLTILSPRAAEKGLPTRLRIVDPVPEMITSDPIRLKQILSNLLGNAIKFTETGEIEILISSTSNIVQFKVRDTGIGLTEEQAKQLFQPFNQADNSISRLYGGTGLGLALSRDLARLLGGDVHLVKSSQGRGTVFEATIKNLSQRESEPPKSRKTRPTEEITLPGLRVLLVEDSLDNQMLISRILSKAGAEVKTAVNGEKGVAAALEYCPDVVLMDISMPVMDGLTAATLLRKKGFLPPIITLSAHAMKNVRDQCIEAGCTDYLAKPISRHDLLSKLKKAVPAPAKSSV